MKALGDLAALRAFGRLALCASLALGVVACANLQPPAAKANRGEGEGYAGVGGLVIRIAVLQDQGNTFYNLVRERPERGAIELRYAGLDTTGRAVFERHDADALAGTGAAVAPGAAKTAAETRSDTRQIILDLRLARQVRIQGKVIEVLEASSSGVVFHIY